MEIFSTLVCHMPKFETYGLQTFLVYVTQIILSNNQLLCCDCQPHAFGNVARSYINNAWVDGFVFIFVLRDFVLSSKLIPMR